MVGFYIDLQSRGNTLATFHVGGVIVGQWVAAFIDIENSFRETYNSGNPAAHDHK